MTTGRRFFGTPLVLRVVLGAVFLWAGVPKVILKMDLTPEQTAQLVNIGAIDAPEAGAAGSGDEGADAAPAETPAAPDVPADAPPPVPDGDAVTPPIGGAAAWGDTAGFTTILAQDGGVDAPAAPEAPPVGDAADLIDGDVAEWAYTAADFPDGAEVRRLYGLVCLMNNLAQPIDADAEGIQVLPTSLADNGQALKYLAWAAGVTELVAGVLVIIGFLTRLSALALAGTMLTALWMTMVGPSVGAPDAFLGFLPAGETAMLGTPEHKTYSTLMLQLTTFATAFALVFIGAGSASLDRFVWGRQKRKPIPAAED